MKRALRILRHAAIAGSAHVCVAAVADRVWDHWRDHLLREAIRLRTSPERVLITPNVVSSQGVVNFEVNRMDFDLEFESKNHPMVGLSFATLPPDAFRWQWTGSFFRRLGFRFGIYKSDSSRNGAWHLRSWFVAAPHWFIATLTGIAPACWLVGHLRRRRDRGATRCRRCGYDLRATPDRCPECGEARERITSPATP